MNGFEGLSAREINNKNIDPELKKFLDDKILSSDEAKILLKILKKHKNEIINYSKENLQKLVKVIGIKKRINVINETVLNKIRQIANGTKKSVDKILSNNKKTMNSEIQKAPLNLIKQANKLAKIYEGHKTVENFKNFARIASKIVEKEYGVPWQVTYAQARLESGNGTSKLSKYGNNFFGHTINPNILKHGNVEKKIVNGHMLGIFVNGKLIGFKLLDKDKNGNHKKQIFAIYKGNNLLNAFREHGKFLKNNFSYAFNTKNPIKFIENLQKNKKHVYAEDKDYKNKLKKFF